MATHPSQWGNPMRSLTRSNQSAIYRLIKAGLIEIVEADEGNVYRLTKKGKMEALILKAKLPLVSKWDGKWRIVIFDIPEKAKKERDTLRKLLLKNDFKKWQASVYISPRSINREAIEYLKETGLFDYIRFARIDELDDDKDLKERFKIK